MPSGVFRSEEFEIDAANRRFTRDGAELALEPKVLSVVLELLTRAPNLISRDLLFDAVWGHRYVTPSTLSRVIALARKAFNDDAEHPRFIQTVHGAGYRFIGRLDIVEAAAEEVQPRFAPPATTRLPARLDALIGREVELETLDKLLNSHRAITVLGTGGMGKTQCALEFARRKAAHFADGVWFFDLAPMQDAGDWLNSLCAALAITPRSRRDTLDKITAQLIQRRALFVVDNCDRIASGVGEIIFELLSAAQHLHVLATSQQQLNYRGEHIMRMPPLALPTDLETATEAGLQSIASAPAMALFLTRIRSAQPAFTLNASNAISLVEICRRLDGMPLALELAAARFSLLSADQVLERLEDRFRFLVSDLAGRERRHRNLLVLLDWSFRLLSPLEQRLLMWMSVFVQGWTVVSAIDVSEHLGTAPELVVDLLSGLANRSLVTADTVLSPPRYRLLESVREYALGRLRDAGEEERARDAHLLSVKHLCMTAGREMLTGRLREWVGQLVHEHGNIEAAIEHGIAAAGNLRAAQSIVGSLLLYFKARGPYVAAFRWAQRALRTTEGPETEERSRALLCLCVVSYYLALPAESTEQLFREAVRALGIQGDPWGEGCARSYYAMWLINSDRTADAVALIDSAAKIAEKLADPWLLGRVAITQSWLHFEAGAYDAAVAVLRPARRLGDDFDQHHFIDMYLGLAYYVTGNYDATARHCLDALRTAIEFGNTRGIAGCAEQYAYLALKMGIANDAARMLGTASGARESSSSPLVRLWVVHHERAVQELRDALGAAAYDDAFQEGQEMRLEDAAHGIKLGLRRYLGRPT